MINLRLTPLEPEEKALFLSMIEGTASDQEWDGPIADRLEYALGLLIRKCGQDGHKWGETTGKGAAYLRQWEEEDGNSE